MSFVLDASLALAWCFPDEVSDYSEQILVLLQSAEAFVPAIWPVEVANALLLGERRQRLLSDQTAVFIDCLLSLPISLRHDDLAHSLVAIRALARAYGLSTYDASYLDLAVELGVPLATLDVRLRDAARRAGVSLLE
jgi:predicted nucleic acid-binding protein